MAVMSLANPLNLNTRLLQGNYQIDAKIPQWPETIRF